MVVNSIVFRPAASWKPERPHYKRLIPGSGTDVPAIFVNVNHERIPFVTLKVSLSVALQNIPVFLLTSGGFDGFSVEGHGFSGNLETEVFVCLTK
jgi:hypothetical protein